MECKVDGCSRLDVHARGMCGKHYQQWRLGNDPFAAGPRPVGSPGWTPPVDLSPAWKARHSYRPPVARSEASCALEACGGAAVQGSAYCAAHKAYREAQARLKVQGRL